MANFDETEDKREDEVERSKTLESTKSLFEMMLRKFVFCVSFGPGVLGVLWLIGRILKR